MKKVWVKMIDTPSILPDSRHQAAEDILAQTITDQHRASNPLNSAWVSANAGSGKTYVLAQRVTRLLLNGVAPSKILCLTFTKAAAAEMSNRVFTQLAQWSALDDDELTEELQKCGERQPGPKMLSTARLLFTRALESPGGLKIQTIHAFCEAVLHQFTLEANTSGHFEVMGDYDQISQLKDARQTVMAATLNDPRMARALAAAMHFGSDQAIENGLVAIIRDRQKFADWIDHHDGSPRKAVASIGEFLCVDVNEPASALTGRLLSQLPIGDTKLHEIELAAGHLDFTECKRISDLNHSYRLAQSAQRKFDFRLGLYQTGAGKFRKKIPGVKALYYQVPGLEEMLEQEMDAIKDARDQYRNWKMLNGSLGLFELGDAVLQTYGQRKRARGLLDYDDLVNRTAQLLARSDVRQWVQYKLDQGIDHVLVDEAQDTSPVQWQIINAITEEFFAGQSLSKSERTIFAVGDQKQSIYSFQGAEPEMFALQRDEIEDKAGAVSSSFENVRLPVSFRSTRDVLSAVDRVFFDPLNAKGLQTNDDPVIHEPVRQSDPGEVLIWPMIEHNRSDKQEDWLLPVDHLSEDHPTLQLARRIAATLSKWINSGESLPGQGRNVTHGDILILVRKRDRFASAITRELKQAGLKVAGADRLNLATHIAIEDLFSLGKWALFPEDDLSLAEVLKSPLFELAEEDLFSLSVDREPLTLWQSLCRKCGENGPDLLKDARRQLDRLKSLAGTTPPYEFFSEILSTYSGRKKFKARLGDEVDDVLDALLLEALNHIDNGGSGLQDFIHNLETAAPDIKREIDLQRDEIRVITVHSAKGLEAPIVFLVDPGGAAFAANHRPTVIKSKCGGPHSAFLWQPGKDDGSEHTDLIHQQIREKAEEEYRRLLYVGMTRAEDRLVICGYANRNSGQQPTWHTMVKDSLINESEEIVVDGEISAWRWQSAHTQRKARKKTPAETVVHSGPTQLPQWVRGASNREADIIAPLFPSHASLSVEVKPRGQNISRLKLDNFAIQKGNATHHLLQYLPSIEQSGRRQRATDYLHKAYQDWSSAQHNETLDDVIAILEDPGFSFLFSDKSQAEVSLAGILDPDDLNRRINGQIDRIAMLEDAVVIVDYKSDRLIAPDPEQVSDKYLVQLAMYRQMTKQIFVGKQVKCALLWTSGPRLMKIPGNLLSDRLDAWLVEAKKHSGVNIDSYA